MVCTLHLYKHLRINFAVQLTLLPSVQRRCEDSLYRRTFPYLLSYLQDGDRKEPLATTFQNELTTTHPVVLNLLVVLSLFVLSMLR